MDPEGEQWPISPPLAPLIAQLVRCGRDDGDMVVPRRGGARFLRFFSLLAAATALLHCRCRLQTAVGCGVAVAVASNNRTRVARGALTQVRGAWCVVRVVLVAACADLLSPITCYYCNGRDKLETLNNLRLY
jgi:hypothetical protein